MSNAQKLIQEICDRAVKLGATYPGAENTVDQATFDQMRAWKDGYQADVSDLCEGIREAILMLDRATLRLPLEGDVYEIANKRAEKIKKHLQQLLGITKRAD